MTVAASVYYVVPKIYGTTIFSEKVANVHFWLVLIGQLIFSVTMWITGIQQGAMWKAMENGKLKYTFVEGLARNYPYYHMRALGGLVFTVGMLFFVYNVLKTIQKGRALAASGDAAGSLAVAGA
jgi:cytochrome c oxidase cbb3-type subunit I